MSFVFCHLEYVSYGKLQWCSRVFGIVIVTAAAAVVARKVLSATWYIQTSVRIPLKMKCEEKASGLNSPHLPV